MANEDRYMPCKAVQLNSGKLIPVWICTLSFQYGSVNRVECSEYDFTELHGARIVDAVYDLKKKALHPYSLVEYRRDPAYAIGDRVACEESHRHLKIKTIKAIEDGRFEDLVLKGEEIDKYLKREPEKFSKDLVIEPKVRYTLRTINPAYILDDDSRVEWDHQLYQIDL